MTDKEVIVLLAARDGWTWDGDFWNKVFPPDKDGWTRSAALLQHMMSHYLASRDSLASVLEKLTPTEKSRLDNKLGWLFWNGKDVYNQNVWPLTLSPATLAHAIAEAIKEG